MKVENFAILIVMVLIFNNTTAQTKFLLDTDIKIVSSKNIGMTQMEFSGNFTRLLGKRFKISNTFKYNNVSVDYQNDFSSSNERLRQYNGIQNTFELSYFLSAKTTLRIQAEPTALFQSKLQLDDIALFGSVEMDYVIDTENTFSFGLKKTNTFGQKQFLPIVSYYHRFSNSTSMDIGFPKAKISYSNNPSNSFMLTNTFSGSYYNLDNPLTFDTKKADIASFAQLTASLEYTRIINQNWQLTFKGGYDFNRKYELLNDQSDRINNFKINHGSSFSVAIKYQL